MSFLLYITTPPLFSFSIYLLLLVLNRKAVDVQFATQLANGRPTPPNHPGDLPQHHPNHDRVVHLAVEVSVLQR